MSFTCYYYPFLRAYVIFQFDNASFDLLDNQFFKSLCCFPDLSYPHCKLRINLMRFLSLCNHLVTTLLVIFYIYTVNIKKIELLMF